MAIFTFRDEKYDSSILEKVSQTGFMSDVEVDSIVDISVNPKAAPVGIKIDGKMHLLLGSFENKHGKLKLCCITKFILKKARIEQVIKESRTKPPTFQERWNAENDRRMGA